jgi:FkbM family methyltransferase
MGLKRIAITLRRRIWEWLGSDKYSRPSLNGLDRKLEGYLDYEGGFFIEAGANDGFSQSNTYYFEKMRSWKGILIEPIPSLFNRCRKLRKGSVVINCALVSSQYQQDSITMVFANLMSLVQGARKSISGDQDHIDRGVNIQRDVTAPYLVSVPAKTLTSILDGEQVTTIDLLSIDVEGYEYDALLGLDLSRYRPRYIVVEANYFDEINAYLTEYGYTVVEWLSEQDVLYKDADGAFPISPTGD